MGRGAESMTMTVGEFLLRRLQEAGVGHLFGVPGDFNLELLQQNEDGGYLKWVGTCNELNSAYAADGVRAAQRDGRADRNECGGCHDRD